MREISLPLHELAFIAATRGLAGAGIGLLLADQLNPAARRAVGWTLLGIGAASTVPLAVSVIRHSSEALPGPR
ncbi:MAG TPA: hypothetical protein VFE23_01415 [Usitatibacter sp.]|jgi:hypothetical protein|nr:hypothetical protein [Usitatibacter sp.]